MPDPIDIVQDGDVLTESAGSRRAEALVQLALHGTAHYESCDGLGGGRHTVIVGLSHQALIDGLGTAGTVWIPSAVLDRDTLYDRTRIGYSIAGQWQGGF